VCLCVCVCVCLCSDALILFSLAAGLCVKAWLP